MVGEKRKIILVDDDNTACILLKMILEKLGHEVLKTFARSDVTLDYFKENHKEVDLVFSDLNLCDEKNKSCLGTQLIQKMREISPKNLQAVIMTADKEFKSDELEVIYKPFKYGEIIRITHNQVKPSED